MANRNMLHMPKLEALKEWLACKGIEHRDGKGEWEVLQVLQDGEWRKVYKRLNMKEHYTVQSKLVPLISEFVKNP